MENDYNQFYPHNPNLVNGFDIRDTGKMIEDQHLDNNMDLSKWLKPTEKVYCSPTCSFCHKNGVNFPYAPDFLCDECKQLKSKIAAPKIKTKIEENKEIEVKIKVSNLDEVKLKINEQTSYWSSSGPPIKYTDIYYDTRNLDLMENDECIRLRKSELDCLDELTIKRSPILTNEIKNRPEFNTRLSYEMKKIILEMIDMFKLHPVVVIEKKRQTYIKLKDDGLNFLIAIDELPILGNFIEIEADSKETIEQVIKTFNIQGDRTIDGYGIMAIDYCRKYGISGLYFNA